jgi:hypothetical protein
LLFKNRTSTTERCIFENIYQDRYD